MKLVSLREAGIILKINFATLFVMIVLTPFFVRHNIGRFSEVVIEGFFLTIELTALVVIFRRYELAIRKKEKEAYLLNSKLKNRERELLGAFEHLGKVNVEISMIKNLFEKMKVPSTKNQLKEMFAEFLRIVCSVTGEERALIRIINLETKQSMGEYSESTKENVSGNQAEISNRDLIKIFSDKKQKTINNYCVFYSESNNFSIKAFLLTTCRYKKNRKANKDELRFLKAIANQCEIIFLLFNSQYYKWNNN